LQSSQPPRGTRLLPCTLIWRTSPTGQPGGFRLLALALSPVRSGCAAAHDACGAGRYLPLVGAAFEGGVAGGTEGDLSEAVLAGVALPASGGCAQDSAARLSVREGDEGWTSCQRVLRRPRYLGGTGREAAVDELGEGDAAGLHCGGQVGGEVDARTLTGHVPHSLRVPRSAGPDVAQRA
jgi:hypothetical protein